MSRSASECPDPRGGACELDEVMYCTTFSQSCIKVVISGCAYSTIETRVLRKNELIIELIYEEAFQYSEFTKAILLAWNTGLSYPKSRLYSLGF